MRISAFIREPRKICGRGVTHDCASILDSIAKGISLFPRFFAWCIPTSIFIQRMIFALVILDIDECAENHDNCEQLCNNRAGDFTCSCRSGYQLDSDGRSCTGKHCVGLSTVVFQESDILVCTCSYRIKAECYGNMLFFTIVVIEFERAVYTVMEDVGSVEVCSTVRREGPSAELQVTFFTEDGTARGK